MELDDPQLTALKSAARAAIVMPAVFLFADKVIQDPQTELFAAFGSIAMLGVFLLAAVRSIRRLCVGSSKAVLEV